MPSAAAGADGPKANKSVDGDIFAQAKNKRNTDGDRFAQAKNKINTVYTLSILTI
jgi:hypothetical protein